MNGPKPELWEDPAELAKITPERITEYLRERGWRRCPDACNRQWWQGPHDPIGEIIFIPLNTRYGCDVEVVQEAIKTLAKTEFRSRSEVWAELVGESPCEGCRIDGRYETWVAERARAEAAEARVAESAAVIAQEAVWIVQLLLAAAPFAQQAREHGGNDDPNEDNLSSRDWTVLANVVDLVEAGLGSKSMKVSDLLRRIAALPEELREWVACSDSNLVRAKSPSVECWGWIWRADGWLLRLHDPEVTKHHPGIEIGRPAHRLEAAELMASDAAKLAAGRLPEPPTEESAVSTDQQETRPTDFGGVW
jgi:hypothetical protein